MEKMWGMNVMEDRFVLFKSIIEAFDEGFDLSEKYDSMPHQYGDQILYQSEMHIIQAIGKSPNTTVTTIANKMMKTKSACSQMVHRLQKKGLVIQKRNALNKREYHLELTSKGWAIFDRHEVFDDECLHRSCSYLDEFSDEELRIDIAVQKRLNEAFAVDVEQNTKVFQK
jgi:DNA-binding MarR family transcriptional regulator